MIQRVCVLGLGYVGLPMAAILAVGGVDVVGVDINVERVEALNSGVSPFSEPNLETLVSEGVHSGRLAARSKPVSADVFVIAVPTPVRADRTADLNQLDSAVHSLASVLAPNNLVVLESTCPVGTTEAVCARLAEARPDLTFPIARAESQAVRVAYCPERVLPGNIVHELVCNDRVIGGLTPSCAQAAAEFYGTFVKGTCHTTDARTAELVKLAENAYRDLNIAFANELAQVSVSLNVNPWNMIDLANRHPRVDILQPGPGVGGHCIPIDPWFIIQSQPKATPLIRAARKVNDAQPGRIAGQAIAACVRTNNSAVACLGLAYKANVGDLRESPAVAVVRQLQGSFAGQILVVEPHISSLPAELASQRATRLVDLDTALDAAQVVVLLTDHEQFRMIDPGRLAGKTIIDSRGVWREFQR